METDFENYYEIDIDDFNNEFKDEYGINLEESDKLTIEEFLYGYFDNETLSNLVKNIMITGIDDISLC